MVVAYTIFLSHHSFRAGFSFRIAWVAREIFLHHQTCSQKRLGLAFYRTQNIPRVLIHLIYLEDEIACATWCLGVRSSYLFSAEWVCSRRVCVCVCVCGFFPWGCRLLLWYYGRAPCVTRPYVPLLYPFYLFAAFLRRGVGGDTICLGACVWDRGTKKYDEDLDGYGILYYINH